MTNQDYILWFNQLTLKDVARVGGKNASLGEMIRELTEKGVQVPNGFATTNTAYFEFLAQNDLNNRVQNAIKAVDVTDVASIQAAGKNIREWILATPLPEQFQIAVTESYQQLIDNKPEITVAVRSSATLEDLPDASFAGQQETFLNVQGAEAVLQKIKAVFSSLFTDRAISYRAHHGFNDADVSISAGVQRMVRSDLASSGVAFTIDTESGFDKALLITGTFGLGELVVQGAVNPDEFYLYKPNITANKPAVIRRTLGSKQQKMIFAPVHSDKLTEIQTVEQEVQMQYCLSDDELTQLGKYAMIIEEHYGRAMDIEWAKDGNDGKIYIVQARPETVNSKRFGTQLEKYSLKSRGELIASGRSVGQKIGKGKAVIAKGIDNIKDIAEGDVLVTDMTDPDWEPIMKKAAAIVTNRGGRTCHAAIIARELGIPAVVGTENATELINNGEEITVSCAEGDEGFIYRGLLDIEIKTVNLGNMPNLPFKIMMNIANPDRAFAFQALPNFGIGLARLEFIINNMIGIHPEACLNFQKLPEDVKQKVTEKIKPYESPTEYYITKLTEGMATLAAAFYPKPVIIRMSDFKSNEYANLIGGKLYEPSEENPMLGFRGASRYVHDKFKAAFSLECEAVKQVREKYGLDNVEIMIPFVRTVQEAKEVLVVLSENGLKRGENGLRVIMMCELPSNALLAEEFLQYFDGFSLGSNDMTQLTLGVDRDSSTIAESFDERNPAVKKMLAMAIDTCKRKKKYIGICGQGPSDHPDFARWLVEQGIQSVSLNPDTVLSTWLFLGEQ